MTSPQHPVLACVFSREGSQPLRSFADATGAFWFLAMDAFPLMHCANSASAMTRFDSTDRKQIGPDNPYGVHPQTRVMSERALCQLAMRSRKAQAAPQAQWVMQHVLPTVATLRLTSRKS